MCILPGISQLSFEKVNPYQTSILTCHIEGILPDWVELYRYSQETYDYSDATGITSYSDSDSLSSSVFEIQFSVDRVVSDEKYACFITNGTSLSSEEAAISTYGMYIVSVVDTSLQQYIHLRPSLMRGGGVGSGTCPLCYNNYLLNATYITFMAADNEDFLLFLGLLAKGHPIVTKNIHPCLHK